MSTTELQRQHAHVMELRRKFSEPPVKIRRSDYDDLVIAFAKKELELSEAKAMIEEQGRKISSLNTQLRDMRSTVNRQAHELKILDLSGTQYDGLASPTVIIKDVLARFQGVTLADLKGYRRSRRLVEARYRCIAAINKARPSMSLNTLGRIFNRDHSSIIHALKAAKERGWV